jgi:hypothetical protein
VNINEKSGTVRLRYGILFKWLASLQMAHRHSQPGFGGLVGHYLRPPLLHGTTRDKVHTVHIVHTKPVPPSSLSPVYTILDPKSSSFLAAPGAPVYCVCPRWHQNWCWNCTTHWQPGSGITHCQAFTHSTTSLFLSSGVQPGPVPSTLHHHYRQRAAVGSHSTVTASTSLILSLHCLINFHSLSFSSFSTLQTLTLPPPLSLSSLSNCPSNSPGLSFWTIFHYLTVYCHFVLSFCCTSFSIAQGPFYVSRPLVEKLPFEDSTNRSPL